MRGAPETRAGHPLCPPRPLPRSFRSGRARKRSGLRHQPISVRQDARFSPPARATFRMLPPPRPHSTKDAEMQVGSVCCDSNPEPTTRSQAICPSLSHLLVDMVLKLLARQSFLLDHGRGHLHTSPALFRHFRGGGSHLV